MFLSCIYSADDSLFMELCEEEAKETPPWEPDGDDVSTCWPVNATALSDEEAFCPSVGQHVELFAGNSAAISNRIDQVSSNARSGRF